MQDKIVCTHRTRRTYLFLGRGETLPVLFEGLRIAFLLGGSSFDPVFANVLPMCALVLLLLEDSGRFSLVRRLSPGLLQRGTGLGGVGRGSRARVFSLVGRGGHALVPGNGRSADQGKGGGDRDRGGVEVWQSTRLGLRHHLSRSGKCLVRGVRVVMRFLGGGRNVQCGRERWWARAGYTAPRRDR